MLPESRAQIQASEAISSASMRYISENLQFSRMKNTIFPQASSQLNGYGSNESVSDIPLQIDSKLHTYDSNLYMDSTLHNQHGVFTICSQSPTINYQSGPSPLMTIKSLDCPPLGANHFGTKATYDSNIVKQQQLSHVEGIPGQPNEIGTKRIARKRPIENADMTSRKSPETIAGNRPPSNTEWTTNKKMAVCFQDHQVPEEIKEVLKDRVPVRRSQKLADKITSLQKLVSPYGKTDTASVLHEATVFIKVLQDQIENTFNRVRSTSMDHEYSQSKITGESQFDLRSMGFCLVPVSLTRNLIREDAFNPYSTANTSLHRIL
ncbi:uncharacterized protein [Coffea arabica]|uniref:BHLH domain-containing protein n=1 Tax=Coffea arabica TaxID=13443 RepID=A0A6P6WM01_COFAR|nr:uncharacterized protein LOC113733468 [Coffea arabica]